MFPYELCVFFRMNFISTSSSIHLAKMEFLENKHHMQAFLTLAESKLKSWIIKYGQQESVELMLHNYIVSSGFGLFKWLFWVHLHICMDKGFFCILHLYKRVSLVVVYLFWCYWLFTCNNIYFLLDSVFSHLWRINISLKIMRCCSSLWNSLQRRMWVLTALVSSSRCNIYSNRLNKDSPLYHSLMIK